MTIYMPRSAWTSTARGGAALTGSKLVGLACHWPGTSTDAYGVETAATVAARLRGWRSYHLSRGWADIGYNIGFDQAGRVWDLRGLGRVGAHAASTSNPDANREWLGCLFILGDSEEPTPALIRAFQDFRHDVFLKRWPGRTRLTGHGRAPGVPGAQTACPGPYVATQITSGSLARTPGGTAQPPQEEFDMDDDHFRRLVQDAFTTAGQPNGNSVFQQMIEDKIDEAAGRQVRKQLIVLIDEAANRSTETGRAVSNDLRAIIQGAQ